MKILSVLALAIAAATASAQAAPAGPIDSPLPPLVIANGEMSGDVDLKLNTDATGSVLKAEVTSGNFISAGYAAKMAKIFRYPNRPNATGIPQHVVFHPAQQAGRKNPVPEYPPIARMEHVFGSVVMVGTLSVDGYVSALQLLSGPPMLQKVSMDAASHWAFVPQTRDGEPVECHIIIQINYNLTTSVLH